MHHCKQCKLPSAMYSAVHCSTAVLIHFVKFACSLLIEFWLLLYSKNHCTNHIHNWKINEKRILNFCHCSVFVAREFIAFFSIPFCEQWSQSSKLSERFIQNETVHLLPFHLFPLLFLSLFQYNKIHTQRIYFKFVKFACDSLI